MSWLDWFKPKVNYWETLYRSEKELADKLYYQLDDCQTDKAQIFTDLTITIKEKQALQNRFTSILSSNAEKDSEIQALKDSSNSMDSDKDKLIKELQATATRRQGTIDNLTRLRDELKAKLDSAGEFTPESLTAALKVKYPDGTDVSKIWDDYAEAIDEAFAVKLIDPVKEISGNEFKDSILKAFPGIKFNSMLMDDLYFCPSCADIIRVIRNDWGNLQPYVPQRGDCNWFAERLRVHFNKIYLLNVGILIVGMAPFGLHAWSIIKGYDGIVVCEPQNDLVVIFPKTIEGYIPREIIIA